MGKPELKSLDDYEVYLIDQSARFANARLGDAQIEIRFDRALDQRVEQRIIEGLPPPRHVGGSGVDAALGSFLPPSRCRYFRRLVVGPDRAAGGQKQQRHGSAPV